MPTPVAEQNVADVWLFDRLTDAVTVPVSSHPAPEQDSPYVTFTVLSAIDNVTGNGHRFITRFRYLVRAIARGRAYPFTLAAEIDQALTLQTGTAAGGSVIACVRAAPFSQAENVDGVEYRHLGGEYLVIVHTH